MAPLFCEGCGKSTLILKLDVYHEKKLCPECHDAEHEYWEKHYADQKALESLYRQAESESE